MKERIALEEQYAKGMQKLAAKAAKFQDTTTGCSMTSAWLTLLKEIEMQAAHHAAIAAGLKQSVTEPLLKIKVCCVFFFVDVFGLYLLTAVDFSTVWCYNVVVVKI
jgi:hypothetical protein